MKRNIIAGLVLICLCGLSFCRQAQAVTVPAEEALPPVATLAAQQVEYTLPYPGILLDHPLYIFKNLRDQAMEFLISDQLKKLEFAILQTDKFLAMGLKYAEGSKWNLVKTAVVRSQAAMDKAITLSVSARGTSQGVPTHVMERLEKSLAKHAEILTDLKMKVPETEQNFYADSLQSLAVWQEKATGLTQ